MTTTAPTQGPSGRSPWLIALALAALAPAGVAGATTFGAMGQSNPYGPTASTLAVGARLQRISTPLIVPFTDTATGAWSYASAPKGRPAVAAGATAIPLASAKGFVAGDPVSSPVLPAGAKVASVAGDTVTLSAGANQNVYSIADLLPIAAASKAAGLHVYIMLRNSCTAFITGSCPMASDRDYGREVALTAQAYARTGVSIDYFAIESEEDSVNNNHDSSTLPQYFRKLRDAVGVLHAMGYKVADGGLTTPGAMYYHWASLFYLPGGFAPNTAENRKRADAFAAVAFKGNARTGIAYDMLPTRCGSGARDFKPTSFVFRSIEKVRAMIADDRTNGVDYLNIHWYQVDPWAMVQVVGDLSRQVGKPAVLGEMGTYDQDPARVTALLSAALTLDPPSLLWWNFDTKGGVTALTNPDGSLRPNGAAFKRFVAAPRPLSPRPPEAAPPGC